jgi:hypothetical protein
MKRLIKTQNHLNKVILMDLKDIEINNAEKSRKKAIEWLKLNGNR